MKNTVLFASISVASGLLFVNLYSSIVDAPSWGSDIPQSMATARDYFKTTNPGHFFRIFSPVNQILGLIALILFWKTSAGIRLYLAVAFGFYLLGDVLTFSYFYPRNEIMFAAGDLTDIASLNKTWSEWSMMNWLRSLVVFIGLSFSCLSLHSIYAADRKEKAFAYQGVL